MKKCPNCNRSYSDESLNFCLDDGTVLTSESDAVTDENILRPTEHQTEILSPDQVTESIPTDKNTRDFNDEKHTVVKSQPSTNDSQPQIIKQGVSPMFAYLSVGLLALLVLLAGAGIGLWINSNSVSETNSEFTKTNSTDSNLKMDNAQENEKTSITLTDRDKPTPRKTPKKETKETQKKDTDDKKTPTPKPTETKKPTPDKTPKPESGKFFVILGSYKDPANAKRRLQLARSRGLPARMIRTNNVPGLRSGLQAVIMGPFSKSAAQKALGRARSVAPDAYVKSG